MKSIHLLHHMKAHHDDSEKCSNLPLESQLNCHCDNLARAGVVDGIIDGVKWHQKLPLELVWILIRNNKQTTYLAKRPRYFIGKENARKFLRCKGDHGFIHLRHSELGWPPQHIGSQTNKINNSGSESNDQGTAEQGRCSEDVTRQPTHTVQIVGYGKIMLHIWTDVRSRTNDRC